MHRTFTAHFCAAATLTVLSACGGEAADDTPALGPEPGEIAERQDNFDSMSDSFKTIRTQLEGGSPDFALIETAAQDINQRANNIENHFPEGSGRDVGYDTEALATIWERPEEFAEAHRKLIEESEEMVTLASAGDAAAVGDQVKALGGSCKDCHDTFRLDDD